MAEKANGGPELDIVDVLGGVADCNDAWDDEASEYMVMLRHFSNLFHRRSLGKYDGAKRRSRRTPISALEDAYVPDAYVPVRRGRGNE